jgi:hypothetical protein
MGKIFLDGGASVLASRINPMADGSRGRSPHRTFLSVFIRVHLWLKNYEANFVDSG